MGIRCGPARSVRPGLCTACSRLERGPNAYRVHPILASEDFVSYSISNDFHLGVHDALMLCLRLVLLGCRALRERLRTTNHRRLQHSSRYCVAFRTLQHVSYVMCGEADVARAGSTG